MFNKKRKNFFNVCFLLFFIRRVSILKDLHQVSKYNNSSLNKIYQYLDFQKEMIKVFSLSVYKCKEVKRFKNFINIDLNQIKDHC